MKKKIVDESYTYEVIDSIGQIVETDSVLEELLRRIHTDYSIEEILTFKVRQMAHKVVTYPPKMTGITFNFKNMSITEKDNG